MTALERADIIEGLRELATQLHREGEVAGVRLVGGAALALRYFDRGVTRDLDALHVHPGSDEAVAAAASHVAMKFGWEGDWLNFAVTRADALPTMGRAVEWEAIYDSGGVAIYVASKEALLAMKLRANRPGRDTRDIRLLLGLGGLATLDEIEELYEEFYPGDALSDRALQMVEAILADGPPQAPEQPPYPDI